MDTSSLVIDGFHYSCDVHSNIYFLFKFSKIKLILEDSLLSLTLNNENYRFSIIQGLQLFDSFSVAVDEYIEVKINAVKEKTVLFSFELFSQESKVQFAPINKEIILNFEKQDFQKWYI